LRSKDRDTLIEKIKKLEKEYSKPTEVWGENHDITRGFNSALDTVKQIILETLK